MAQKETDVVESSEMANPFAGALGALGEGGGASKFEGAPDPDGQSMSDVVQRMWHKSDVLRFAARGDKDMSKPEIAAHLDKHSNPFEPLPEGNGARIAEAVKSGDLEALKKISNVHIYQTYEDQRKDEGEEGLEDGQVVLTAKEIWKHFEELRELRRTLDNLAFAVVIDQPKWTAFLRFYATLFGWAATPDLAPRFVDTVRDMCEQKNRMETDAAYTRAHADAAIDYQSNTSWVKQCPQKPKK